jgi:hypothetical protein
MSDLQLGPDSLESRELSGETDANANAYRIAYRERADSSHEADPERVGADESRGVELVAADGDLREVVNPWVELPAAVRVGTMHPSI